MFWIFFNVCFINISKVRGGPEKVCPLWNTEGNLFMDDEEKLKYLMPVLLWFSQIRAATR